jgi:GntR family transcriptional regulator
VDTPQNRQRQGEHAPKQLVEARADNRRTRHSTGGSRLRQLGYNSVEFIDRVSVRLPTTQEFEVLELPDDIPVHRTFRTYYTAEGVPFEVTVMIQGAHLYGLQYRQPTRESSQAAQ